MIDWPMAAIIVAGIVGVVVMFVVERQTCQQTFEAVINMRTSIGELHHQVQNISYRVSELERSAKKAA